MKSVWLVGLPDGETAFAPIDRRSSMSIPEAIPDGASIDCLEISVRAHNCLLENNIKTVGEARRKTDGELLRTPNFGRVSLRDLRQALGQEVDPILRQSQTVIAFAVEAMRSRCEAIALDWMDSQTMKLRAGEMTAQEVRSVQAVVGAIVRSIAALKEGNA